MHASDDAGHTVLLFFVSFFGDSPHFAFADDYEPAICLVSENEATALAFEVAALSFEFLTTL